MQTLQKNMLTYENINNFCKNIYIHTGVETETKTKVETETKTKTKVETKTNETISNYKIIYKDTLFWCFYILKYGISKYESHQQTQSFTIEKDEKYKCITLLRNNKNILKTHKIKPLSEIENNLANEEQINIKTFISLCLVENINIFIVDDNNRTFYEFIIDANKPIIGIFKKKNEKNENKYYINFETNLNYYRTNYLFYDGKIKSISSYKVSDLELICNKLNIIFDTKSKKKDLYEKIVLFFR
jgi:hypothetical protein